MNHKKVIAHIYQSVLNAESMDSMLDDRILNLPGWSSYKIRHLLNNLLSYDDEPVNYLEIGTYQGSTFASALHMNDVNSAYAIDNFLSLKPENKEIFFNNVKDYKYTFIEDDCWQVDLSRIKHKINFYLFDGGHTYDDHYKAVEYYLPAMDDEFVLIVDDYDPHPDWIQVSKATQQAIQDLNLTKIHEVHLKSTGRNAKNSWWNGYYIALLKKPANE